MITVAYYWGQKDPMWGKGYSGSALMCELEYEGNPIIPSVGSLVVLPKGLVFSPPGSEQNLSNLNGPIHRYVESVAYVPTENRIEIYMKKPKSLIWG